MPILLTALAGIAWTGNEPIYNEKADPKKEIAAAIDEASRPGHPPKRIALVFGANWCFDCHALDEAMHRGELARLIEQDYIVIRVNVGRMDKNLDLASRYGVPIKKGIPALAILDAHGKLLYAQDQGQFADARHMTYEGIQVVFDAWKPKR